MNNSEFKEIIKSIQNEYPVMEEEVLREHIIKYRETGDQEIRNKIILSNIGLGLKYANKYQIFNQFLEVEDLFNETFEALISAVDRFDLDAGTKFSTYATYWIKQKILRVIGDTGHTIRLPIHFGESMRKAKRYLEEANKEGYTQVTVEKLMEKADVSKEVAEYVLLGSMDIVSLNTKISTEDSEATELGDFIPANEETENDAIIFDFEERVHDAIGSKLTEKEQDIINRRFGLNGYKPMTLQEVGDIYHLSRERIRQMEDRALRKLKRCRELRVLNTTY